MAHIQSPKITFTVVCVAALIASFAQAAAQQSAAPESEATVETSDGDQKQPSGVEGPILLDANDPPLTGTDAELPEPVRGPLPGATSTPAESATNEPAARTRRATSAPSEALPPPREHSLIQDSTRDTAPVLGMTLGESVNGKVAVRAVEPRSPAARAGLERGDVVWAINDERVRSVADARAIVEATEPDDVLEIDYSRDLRTRVALEDSAVRTAGYAEDDTTGRYDGAADRTESSRTAPYRDDARYRTTTEELPLPSRAESTSRRRDFFYAPDADVDRERNESQVVRRRTIDDDDRERFTRERDDEPRRFFRRPLLPWRRN